MNQLHAKLESSYEKKKNMKTIIFKKKIFFLIVDIKIIKSKHKHKQNKLLSNHFLRE